MAERYKEIKLLGKGSFGRAVLAQEKSTGDKYVMKVIQMSTMKPKEREDALMEAKILSKLQHPYIVGYKDSFVDSKYLYIIMEYADRGDLFDQIKKQKMTGRLFPEAQIWEWFVQICLALKHVHDRKILHRDIKSQNVFMVTDKRTGKLLAKLGDFGIARVLQGTMDLARTAIGTPYYLSPEIAESKPYSNKSDVWSMGVMLYELCTFNHAFDAQNMKGLVLKILRGQYSPISSQYSGNMREMISRMLMKDPSKRPSINQILKLPFLQEYIRMALPSEVMENEFSHTILHGKGNALVGFRAQNGELIGRPGVPSQSQPSSGKPPSSAAPPPSNRAPSNPAPPNPPQPPRPTAAQIAAEQVRRVNGGLHAPYSVYPQRQGYPAYPAYPGRSPSNPGQQGPKYPVPLNGGRQPNRPTSAAQRVPPGRDGRGGVAPNPVQVPPSIQPGIQPGPQQGKQAPPPAPRPMVSYEDLIRQERERAARQQQERRGPSPQVQHPQSQPPPAQPQPRPAVPASQPQRPSQTPPRGSEERVKSAATLYREFADVERLVSSPPSAVGRQPPAPPPVGVARQVAENQRRSVLQSELQSNAAAQRQQQRAHKRDVQRQLAPVSSKEQARNAREQELAALHAKAAQQREESERRIREQEEKRRKAQEEERRKREAMLARKAQEDRLLAERERAEAAAKAKAAADARQKEAARRAVEEDARKRRAQEQERERAEKQAKDHRPPSSDIQDMIARYRSEQHGKKAGREIEIFVTGQDDMADGGAPGLAVPGAAPEAAPQPGAPLTPGAQKAFDCLNEADSDDVVEDAPLSDAETEADSADPADPADAAGAARRRQERLIRNPAAMAKYMAQASKEETISYKMEVLRVYLEKELGFDRFCESYKYVCDCSARADEDFDSERVVRIVGDDKAGYVNLIINLMYCEERFNSQ